VQGVHLIGHLFPGYPKPVGVTDEMPEGKKILQGFFYFLPKYPCPGLRSPKGAIK
jgi:hypothetical protein